MTNKNKIHEPNGITYNKLDIANIFADCFENVHNLTKDFGNPIHNNKIKKNYTKIIGQRKEINIVRVAIHTKDIKDVIKKLKNKKAPGIDGITNTQIKNVPNKMIAQLFYVYNYCFKKSYFPNIWKIAKILPLPKSNKDHLFPQNYRPISLLNSLTKIFEKLIYNKIDKHSTTNKIINNEQFGF